MISSLPLRALTCLALLGGWSVVASCDDATPQVVEAAGPTGGALLGGPWLEWPFAAGVGVIYQTYGQGERDNPLNVHEGLDIAVPAGTPVYSPLKGEVSMNFEQGYPAHEQGLAIRGFNAGQEVFVKLLHLDRASIQFLLGDRVEAGDLIGFVREWGGDPAFESHLHIEVGGASLYAKLKERQDGIELGARDAFSPLKNPLAWLKKPEDNEKPRLVPLSEGEPLVFRAYRERDREDDTPGEKLDPRALRGGVDIEFGIADGYSSERPSLVMPKQIWLEILTDDERQESVLQRHLTLDGPLETTSIYSRRLYLDPPANWPPYHGFHLRLLSLRGIGGEELDPSPWDTTSCDPGPYRIRILASDFHHREVLLGEFPVVVAPR